MNDSTGLALSLWMQVVLLRGPWRALRTGGASAAPRSSAAARAGMDPLSCDVRAAGSAGLRALLLERTVPMLAVFAVLIGLEFTVWPAQRVVVDRHRAVPCEQGHSFPEIPPMASLLLLTRLTPPDGAGGLADWWTAAAA